ncbi:MAG TPA: rhodanese-like domain-containing protein [Thermoleophilaceae bacterium]|nr:rhodanese-like domain-containing protein [Thermoleophilaceae bacterium]
MGSFTDDAHELSPEEVRDRLGRGEIEVIDVREQYEWDAGRIAGARHVPLASLGGAARELSRDHPVVFVCTVGARSGVATEAFRASGWEAYNMDGGMRLWAERGLPLEPAGGVVADH